VTIDFETKDSGQHAEYASGMRRDTQEGKPRFALMVTKLQPYEDQMLTRYAKLLARGAEKYDDRNWEEGNSEEELERAKDSLLRHTMQLIAGERDEDHAAAVWFNTQAIEYFRWRIEQEAEGKGYEYESDIRHEALKRAAAMRRKERIAKAASDVASSAELDDDPDTTGAAKVQGAHGLFQFIQGPWPKPQPRPADFEINLDGVVSKLADLYGPQAKWLRRPEWTAEQKEQLAELLKKWGIDTKVIGL